MDVVIYTVFVFLLLLVCVNDFVYYRISNIHVLFIITVYCVGIYTGNIQEINFWKTFNYACLAFTLLFILNHLNCIGGGDVKLVFVLIFWVGNQQILLYMVIVSFISLLLSVIYYVFGKYLFYKREALSKAIKSNPVFSFLITPYSIEKYVETKFFKCEIPYGIPLALGAFCMVFLFRC